MEVIFVSGRMKVIKGDVRIEGGKVFGSKFFFVIETEDGEEVVESLEMEEVVYLSMVLKKEVEDAYKEMKEVVRRRLRDEELFGYV